MERRPSPAVAPDASPHGNLRQRVARWFAVARSFHPSVTYDGRAVLFLGDATGLPQAWSVPITGGPPSRLRESPERVGDVRASPTGPRAVVAQDAGGNEVWQLELVSLTDTSGRTRESRRPLTADPKVMNLPGMWMSDGHRYLFSSNARNHAFFDVYRLDIDAWSPPERIWTGDAWQQVAATRGDRVLVQRFRTFLDSDLILLDRGGSAHLNPHREEETVSSADIGPDGVYVGSNPGREYLALVRYPFTGGTPELLREYPGDVELVRAAPDGRRLAVGVNRDGWSELHLVDVASGADRRIALRPRGVIEAVSWAPDGTALAYDLSWPNGHEVFWRSLDARTSVRLTRSAHAPPRVVPKPKLGAARSADGLRLPYWEHTPPRRRPRGTIVVVHGGPEAQARPWFDPELGSMLEDGWRVIEPNVRGSTGYGRTYLHLDDVRRRMDSVRDLKDLADALVRSKRASAGRIGVLGGSYGGFMVLAAITTYPELWGAAVELYGISNLVTFLERTADWRRALREAEYGSLERDRAFMDSISPIRHIERVRAPLFVLHGRNDPRVPIHEAEQMVAELRDRGRTVESLYFDNEGHGFARRENQIETAVRTAEFFDRYLPRPRVAARRPAPARGRTAHRRRAGRRGQ